MSTSESAADCDADASIHLHAELLPNIRQLTLYVSLPAYPDSDPNGNAFHPQISLSESRRAVTVTLTDPDHEMSETIKLPARVSEASRASLKFTGHRVSNEGRNGGDGDAGRREFSFRMQVDKDEGQPRVAKEDYVDDFIPWTAMDMTPSTGVRCRACGHVVLDPSGPPRPSSDATAEGSAQPPPRGWVWKDLPSGNWAEMMDFWHCHKPHNPEQDHLDQNSEVKGYGAANQVVATPGTVLVDVPSFLVTEVDCKGLKKVRRHMMSLRLRFQMRYPVISLLPRSLIPIRRLAALTHLLSSTYHKMNSFMFNSTRYSFLVYFFGQKEGGLFAPPRSGL